MKTWKLTSGILCFVLSGIVMLQLMSAEFLESILEYGEFAGLIGVLFILLMTACGTVSITMRGTDSMGGKITLIFLFSAAWLLGTFFSGDYADLHLWAGMGLLGALVSLAEILYGVIFAKQEENARAMARVQESRLPGASVSKWFYQRDGKWNGPFTREQIPELVEKGYLTGRTPVCHEGAQRAVCAEDSAIRSFLPAAAVTSARSPLPLLVSILVPLFLGGLGVWLSVLAATGSVGEMDWEGADTVSSLNFFSGKPSFEKIYLTYEKEMDAVLTEALEELGTADGTYDEKYDVVVNASEAIADLAGACMEALDAELWDHYSEENEEEQMVWYDKLDDYTMNADDQLYEALDYWEENYDTDDDYDDTADEAEEDEDGAVIDEGTEEDNEGAFRGDTDAEEDDAPEDVFDEDERYQEMLYEAAERAEQAVQDLLDRYPELWDIEYNDDFTEFTVYVDTDEYDMSQGFPTSELFSCGRAYNAVAGSAGANIHADFIDMNTGDLIEEADSSASV